MEALNCAAAMLGIFQSELENIRSYVLIGIRIGTESG